MRKIIRTLAYIIVGLTVVDAVITYIALHTGIGAEANWISLFVMGLLGTNLGLLSYIITTTIFVWFLCFIAGKLDNKYISIYVLMLFMIRIIMTLVVIINGIKILNGGI